MSNNTTNMNKIAVSNRIKKAKRLVSWIKDNKTVFAGTDPADWEAITWELINKAAGEKSKTLSRLTTMTVLTLLDAEGVEF